MHSSRMRTICSSGRISGGGGGTWSGGEGGVPGPGGGGGVPGPGGVTWFRGVYLVLGGVPDPGGWCT